MDRQCSRRESKVREPRAPPLYKSLQSRRRGCHSCDARRRVTLLTAASPPLYSFELLGEHKFAPINLVLLRDNSVVLVFVTSGGGAGYAPFMPTTTSGNRQASPTRASLRLQGLPPELGLLPDKLKKEDVVTTATNDASTMTEASSVPVVLQQPREPPSFHGSPTEDPEEWLEHLERVRRFNRWDDDETLRQVFFYLEDSARIWFENHERTLTTWELFKTELSQTFTTLVRKERAEQLLQTRTQYPNESVLVFVEDMKRLFRRTDPGMTEEKKLRFLMRGVKQELFACLVRNPPKTVSEFASEAAALEKTLEIRTRQYDRPINALVSETIGASAISSDSLRDTIRAVVREELRKLFPTTTPQPQVASLTDVIREEVQQALGTSMASEAPREPEAMTYSAAVRRPRPVPTPRQETPPYRRPMSPARPPVTRNQEPRKTEVWRTPDNRPLCYHCGEPDHIYRRCPYRRRGLRGFSVDAPRPRPGQRPTEIAEYLSNTGRGPARFNRSPSPYPYQSPTRRSYDDFARGRSPSPRGGN